MSIPLLASCLIPWIISLACYCQGPGLVFHTLTITVCVSVHMCILSLECAPSKVFAVFWLSRFLLLDLVIPSLDTAQCQIPLCWSSGGLFLFSTLAVSMLRCSLSCMTLALSYPSIYRFPVNHRHESWPSWIVAPYRLRGEGTFPGNISCSSHSVHYVFVSVLLSVSALMKITR